MPSSPPEESRSTWPGPASSGWQYSHSAMSSDKHQLEPLPRPSTSGAALGGLVIPDPQYVLRAPSPVDRQAPVYVAPSHLVPASPSAHVQPRLADPAVHEERRARRERYEDINLPPLQVETPTSSQFPALPLPPSGSLLAISTGPPHMSPISPSIPPPFTLEPRPRWQRDPVLPIGPAWRGSNLFGSTRVSHEGPRRVETLDSGNLPSASSTGHPRIPRPAPRDDEPSASSPFPGQGQMYAESR